MPIKFPSLRSVQREAVASARRFPETLAASFVCGLVAWAGVEKWISDAELAYRAVMSLSLAIPFSFTVATFHERRPRADAALRAAWMAAVLLFSALVFFSYGFQTYETFFCRFWQLNLAIHLLVAFLPYARGGKGAGFWAFNESLFARFVAAVFFSGVITLGLIVALGCVHYLLGIKIEPVSYARVAIAAAFVFNTWFFLSGVPRPLPAAAPTGYPPNLKILTQYLLIPLVTLYFLILFAYLFKIVVTHEWPKGTVGYLVSVFSCLGIFTLLLAEPRRERPDGQWLDAYARVFYLALYPLVVLLLLGAWRRVTEYGITERRYLLVALGLWLAGMATYFSFSRRKDIRVIPFSLCLVTLLTSFGPWGAYAVSYRDQLSRLERHLRVNGILVNGKVKAPATVPPLEERKTISALVKYLNEAHGGAGITGWFDLDEKDRADAGRGGHWLLQRSRDDISRKMVDQMGFKFAEHWESEGSRSGNFYYQSELSSRPRVQVMPVRGYSALVRLQLGANGEATAFAVNGKPYETLLRRSPPALVFRFGGHEVPIPLTAKVRELGKIGGTHMADRHMTLELNDPRLTAQVHLTALNGTDDSDGLSVSYLDADVLIR